MTIITAAIKDNKVSISSDTQTNFGSLKVHASRKVDSCKLFFIKQSIIGIAGWSAITNVFESLVENEPKTLNFNTRREIFGTLIDIQEKLKDDYFVETREDRDQPVESNQLDGLVINPNGIFSFGSYREVHQWNKFWALGSGKRLALGAMHALYDTKATAKEIAEAGVQAAAEFDDACSLPLHSAELEVAQRA